MVRNAPLDVRVCLIEPGFINSAAFQSVYQTAGSGDLASPYAPYYRHMGKLIQRMMGVTVSTSDSVATRIVAALAAKDPPLRLPATIDAGAFYWLRRLLPRGLIPPAALCVPAGGAGMGAGAGDKVG